jgi:serine/threonine-protein kinase
MPEGLQAALGDRYRLERELGGGGMSRVYLAEEVALGRRVVIKLIPPELAQGLSAERFEREVKLAARLQQANIVPVLTAGDAAGLPYYVMPYVDGESLRAELGGAPVPPSEALSLLRDVARALAYAHAHGVVHRDIKPENILLSGGAAVVTDFGIAKALAASQRPETGEGAGDLPTLTQAGNSIGTPAYMAPEQAVGAPVDHRADLYAWGIVAYELLSGKHPFSHRSGSQQLIAAHIAERPAPLSGRAPTVPRAVADLVMQCLEKDPAQRPASADVLAAGLSGAAMGAGGRGGMIAAGVALLVMAVALYLWKSGITTTSTVPQNRRVVAILPFRNLSPDTSQAYFSAGMTEEVTSQLGKVAALRVLGRAATAPYENEANRLQRMGKELGVGSVVDGSVQLAGDRVRINVTLTDVSTGVSLWSEKYDREVSDLFALQDDVARKVTTALQARLTDVEAYRLSRPPTSSLEAYQVYLRARALSPTIRADNLQQAELLRQAVAIDTSFALAYAYLGRNYMFRGVAGQPSAIDSGFAAARRAIALDSTLADGYFALGDLLSVRNQLSNARDAYLKALARSPSHDGVMADLSNIFLAEGEYDRALDMALRAAQINPRHPHVGYHVGIALLYLGDDSVTSRYLLGAERSLPDVARTQALLAWLALRRGDTTTALVRMRASGRSHPDDAETEAYLAEMAVTAGTSDAADLLQPLVARDPTSPSQFSAADLGSLYGLLLARRGDSAAAHALWSRSRTHGEALIREGAEGSYQLMQLAAIDAMEGNTTRAFERLEQSHQAGFNDAAGLRIDPSFIGLRRDPRFGALLASMDQQLAIMRQRAAKANPDLFKAR